MLSPCSAQPSDGAAGASECYSILLLIFAAVVVLCAVHTVSTVMTHVGCAMDACMPWENSPRFFLSLAVLLLVYFPLLVAFNATSSLFELVLAQAPCRHFCSCTVTCVLVYVLFFLFPAHLRSCSALSCPQ